VRAGERFRRPWHYWRREDPKWSMRSGSLTEALGLIAEKLAA
jgi:hypothetical protein